MQAIKHLLFTLAGFCFMTVTSAALAQETPAAAPAGVTMVEAKEVVELQKQGAILVDTRKASEFGEGTLKGAISVPYDPEKSAKDAHFDPAQDKFNMAKLPDKNARIVVFCNSGTCWKSYKSAVVLAKNGYKNVYWYRNGFPDWKARKLPID
ncbi:MAG: rhodanese-like domain-containing protein [Betaproteobacteria bacterium]|nr:rhodanese-like domain-containing protein [Betaproteobacteria bacterium]